MVPLVGALGGAAVTFFIQSSLNKSHKKTSKTNKPPLQKKPKQEAEQEDPAFREVISHLEDYKHINPKAYDNFLFTLNRLVGLQNFINQKGITIQASYTSKAIRYQNEIKRELNHILKTLQNQSSTQAPELHQTAITDWKELQTRVETLLEDYVSNITMDITDRLMSSLS